MNDIHDKISAMKMSEQLQQAIVMEKTSLHALSEIIAVELKKPIFKRRVKYLIFLSYERRKYEHSIRILELVLSSHFNSTLLEKD